MIKLVIIGKKLWKFPDDTRSVLMIKYYQCTHMLISHDIRVNKCTLTHTHTLSSALAIQTYECTHTFSSHNISKSTNATTSSALAIQAYK